MKSKIRVIFGMLACFGLGLLLGSGGLFTPAEARVGLASYSCLTCDIQPQGTTGLTLKVDLPFSRNDYYLQRAQFGGDNCSSPRRCTFVAQFMKTASIE